MSSDPVITPQMVAEFDQSYAASCENLAYLLTTFQLERDRLKADGAPFAAIVMTLASSLRDHWSPDQLASALAVGVVVMTGSDEGE